MDEDRVAALNAEYLALGREEEVWRVTRDHAQDQVTRIIARRCELAKDKARLLDRALAGAR